MDQSLRIKRNWKTFGEVTRVAPTVELTPAPAIRSPIAPVKLLVSYNFKT